MAKTQQIKFNDKLKGPKFLAPVIRTVNQMAKMLNGFALLSGGDVIMREDGLLLRIKTQIVINENPWLLYQDEADEPGLVISMVPGVVQYSSASTGNPITVFVTMTPFTLTDNTTTKIYLKASVEATTYGDYYELWSVTALSVESGASVPSDTLDISAGTDGDIYIEIGEVTTDTGEIDDITQVLASSVPITFPLTLVGPSTGTHVLVSEDGDVAWVEADPEPACPEEEEET